MTIKKAKERLLGFQKRMDSGEWDEPFHTELLSVFKHIFGPTSHEYLFVKNNPPFNLNYVDKYYIQEHKDNKENIKKFIPRSVSLIDDKGVYKAPKENIISAKSTWSILLIFLSIFAAGLVIGSFWPQLAESIKVLWK